MSKKCVALTKKYFIAEKRLSPEPSASCDLFAGGGFEYCENYQNVT